MPGSTGGVIMPPVPPRSFPQGAFSFLFTVVRYFRFKIDFISFPAAPGSDLCSVLANIELESLDCFLYFNKRPSLNFFAGHFLMHCDAFHHQNSDPPPALPVRSLRKVQPSQK